MKPTTDPEISARREQVEQLLGNRPAPAVANPAPAPAPAPTDDSPAPTKKNKKPLWIAIAAAVLVVAVVLALLIPLLSDPSPHSSPEALGIALEEACLDGDAVTLADLLGYEDVEAFETALRMSSPVLSSSVAVADEPVTLYYIDCVVSEEDIFAILYLCDSQGTPYPVYAYKDEDAWFAQKDTFLNLFIKQQLSVTVKY